MTKFKTISLSLAVIAALGFSGCGSSSSDDSVTPTTTSSESSKEVTVERGATYDANVTDANGQVAEQKNGENVYVFATVPKYPIIVNGGWIDVNGDGELDTNDTLLNTTMKSYSDVVTPITTYIADSNKTIRENKLKVLSTLSGASETELLKVASKADTKAILTINAVYQEMIDQNTTSIETNKIQTTLSALQNIDLTGLTDSKLIARKIEKKTMENLLTKGKISALSMSDLDEIQKFKVFGITWKNRKKDDYSQRSYKGNTVKVINDEIVMTAKKRDGSWSSRAELRANLKTPITSYTAKIVLDSMSNDYGKAQINAYFQMVNPQGGGWKQLQTSISIRHNKIWYGIFKEDNNNPYIAIDSKSETKPSNTFKNVTLSCNVKLVGDNIIFKVKDLTNNIDYTEQTFDLSNESLWNEMNNNQRKFGQILVRSVFDSRNLDSNKTDYSNTIMKLIDLDME